MHIPQVGQKVRYRAPIGWLDAWVDVVEDDYYGSFRVVDAEGRYLTFLTAHHRRYRPWYLA